MKILTEISFENGRILFDSSPARKDLHSSSASLKAYQLDKLRLVDNTGALIKSFVFNYSYFESNDNPDAYEYDKLRLKLNKLTESGQPAHSFEYDALRLPSKTSNSRDYQGFYNGISNGIMRIPTLWQSFGTVKQLNVGGADFSINPSFMQAGLLKRVQYPTGGRKEFEFEPNTAQTANEMDSEGTMVSYKAFDSNGSADKKKVTFEIKAWTEVDFEVNGHFATPTPPGTVGLNECFLRLSQDNVGIYYLDWDQDPSNNAMPLPTHLPPGTYTLEANLYNGLSGNLSIGIKFDERFIGGGLRIKKISSYTSASDTAPLTYSFLYGQQSIDQDSKSYESRSSGVLRYNVNNFTFSKSEYLHFGGIEAAYAKTYIRSERLSSESSTSVGSPIVYRNVTVVYGGGNDNIGSIESTFDVSADIEYGGFTLGVFPSFASPTLGLISQQIIRDKSTKILQQLGYSYEYKNTTFYKGGIIEKSGIVDYVSKLGRTCTPNSVFLVPDCPSGLYKFYSYIIPSIIVLNKSAVKTEKNDVYPLVTEKTYKYESPSHLFPTTITESTNSDGAVTVTKRIYPSDYTNITGFIADLKTNFIYDKIIEEVSFTQKGIDMDITRGQITLFKPAPDLGLVDSKYVLELNVPLKASSFIFSNRSKIGDIPPTGTNGQFNMQNISSYYGTEPEIKVNNYDDAGNVESFQSNGSPATLYIWGYNKTYPVAKLENVAYSQISTYISNIQNKSNADNDHCTNSQGGSTCKEKELRAVLNGLRAAFPAANITTFTYDPLIGMTSQTDANGSSHYYEYDNIGRLQNLKESDDSILKNYQYQFQVSP